MKRKHLLFALRVLVLLILQIVVCNELFLWRFATPFVYPVLLFFFPLGAKKYLYTLSGGIVGLIMDAASGAAGAGDAGAGAGAGAPGGDGTIYGTDFEDKTGDNK
mgnify:CR=1 FL=1